MIRGLDLFREHFADYRNAFVLIGGVACHEWLSTQGLPFRGTKDMDMVLIVEALDAAFVKRFWEFIEAGKYRGRYKAKDGRELYRFDEPEDERYPAMMEIFSRKPANIDLAEGQHIVPIKLDEDSAKARTSPSTARTYFGLQRRSPGKQDGRSQVSFKRICESFLRRFPLRTRKRGRRLEMG
jgi:hypothetical protein